MVMEKKVFADLPFQLGRRSVADCCLAEAYRWEMAGVYSEAQRWRRAYRSVTEADQQRFAQMAAAAADVLAGIENAGGAGSVVRAVARADFLRLLRWFHDLSPSRQADLAIAAAQVDHWHAPRQLPQT